MSRWTHVTGTVYISGLQIRNILKEFDVVIKNNNFDGALLGVVPHKIINKFCDQAIVFNFDSLNKKILNKIQKSLECGSEGPIELMYGTFNTQRRIWGSDGCSSSWGTELTINKDGEVVLFDDVKDAKRVSVKHNGECFAITMIGDLRNCSGPEACAEFEGIMNKLAKFYDIRETFVKIDDECGETYEYIDCTQNFDFRKKDFKVLDCTFKRRVTETLYDDEYNITGYKTKEEQTGIEPVNLED